MNKLNPQKTTISNVFFVLFNVLLSDATADGCDVFMFTVAVAMRVILAVAHLAASSCHLFLLLMPPAPSLRVSVGKWQSGCLVGTTAVGCWHVLRPALRYCGVSEHNRRERGCMCVRLNTSSATVPIRTAKLRGARGICEHMISMI